MKIQNTILAILLLGATACGGAQTKRSTNKEGVPEPPDVKGGKGGATPGGGTAAENISVDARKDYETAAAAFAENEKNGWDKGSCKASAERFAAVVREHAMVEAQYMVGRSYHACGMLDDAEAAYQAALNISENHSASISNLGEIYWQKGKKDSAKKYWETAVKADPKIVAARANLAMLMIEDLRTMEVNSDEWKKTEKAARDHLSSVLAVDNDHLRAYVLYGMLYMEGRQKNKNRLDLAKLLLDEGAKRKEDFAPLQHAYGLYYLYKNNLTEALAKFSRAVELDPNFPEARMNVGLITLGYRKYDVAKENFEKVLSLQDGNNYDALIGLAVAQRGLNDLAGAEDTYNKAVKLDAKRGEAYFDLGVLYKDFLAAKENDLKKSQDRYKTARDYFKKFLDQKGIKADDKEEASENIKDCDKVVKQLDEFIKMQASQPEPEPTPPPADDKKPEGGK